MSPFLSFRRSRGPVELAVGMAGVRMGERVLHVGTGDPRLFALVSSKAGLTGRACAIVDSAAAQATLERAAARQGVLVEVALVPPGENWSYARSSFDVAMVDGNALLSAATMDRQNRLANTFRVVRPGGRVLVVLRRTRRLAARLGFERAGGVPGARALDLVRALEESGCRPVRVLAEREGLSFIEGFRPNA
jgi:ubiquinone/menaquinone biosynthesis C-methylase UbiE